MSDLSNSKINGEPQTWEQLYEREKAAREALEAYRSLVNDLSRCPHGRHLRDVCSGCGGPSKGNPHAIPGSVIGYNINGRPWVVPPKAQFAKIEDWAAAPAQEGDSE